MKRWILTMLGRRALHIAIFVAFLCISIVSSLPTAALKNAAAQMPNTTRNSLLLHAIKDHSAHFNTESSNSSNISRKLLDNFNFTSSTSSSLSDGRNSRYNKTLERRYRRSGNRGAHVERFLYSTAKLKQLYCRTGYRLAVYDNGTINGTKRIDNPYSLLSISARSFGVVNIKGVYSGLYVCMDERGRLYGSEAAVNDCLFEERLLSNWYTTFSSRTHPVRRSRRQWYLAINKDGSSRNGARTKAKHNMAQFLPI